MQHQPPIVRGHIGGRQLSEEQAEIEWCAAWEGIAAACECGLKGLHSQHPRRNEMLALMRDARSAARLPDESRLQSA